MLNLNSLLIGTDNQPDLVEFYTKVFEKEPDMNENDYAGWLVGKCFVTIGKHSEISGKSKEPQRIIFNLETDEVQEEFDRVKEIEGVEVIKEPYTMGEEEDYWIATLADPDGNYFQLVTPWKEK